MIASHFQAQAIGGDPASTKARRRDGDAPGDRPAQKAVQGPIHGHDMTQFPDYKTVSTESLVPYARNSRTHSDEQVSQIAASIKEFGFLNPIITDGDNGIIAGHGRVLAAQRLGLQSLPCIEAAHLTEAQRKAYVIADNKLALNAGWDDEMLKVELEELGELGFDLELTGFSLDEVDDLLGLDAPEGEDENPYSKKVDAPVYEPVGEKPLVGELYDNSKAEVLLREIQNSSLPEDEKLFLAAAAGRHVVFDFEQIANFYAHSDIECQTLMEDSALVIIDFDKAITQGYVKLSEEIAKSYAEEKGVDGEE